MAELIILAAAEEEYNAGADWYAAKSESAADRFTCEVEDAIQAIREHPDRYQRWDDTYSFYLLNRFPYYVAYRYTSNRIVVVAIRHSSQDQDAWQGR
jgi:plasmid stabilization system protein ParE